MAYKITVTVTATIEKPNNGSYSNGNATKVGQMSHTVERTNGAPYVTYSVHDIEAGADEAAAVVAKMAEAAYGRSDRPDWEC